MKKINFALVKLIQFMVFVIFTFVVLAYFGAFVLLPLDAIALLVKLLSAIGLNGFIAAFIAIPAIGYLCFMVYKTPNLVQTVIDTGIDLVKTGKDKVAAFNTIADTVKN
ncbi:MAG: hypothetical protein CTY34_11340 [Methylobacter sp.]|nr:MAG: hypothetical protein CTY34_11340 [Methylobacter sp.]PPD02990.1 MAG: hypothetical protein CTY29_11150 [Methylobacter sp.]PPD23872.1 MAG: hypothetical protein CTY24_02725 [Methylobacter sp.]